MIHHIDVTSVLQRAVCDLYTNLVTRPTGARVREEIETYLAGVDDPSLTIIDFSHVTLLDFSCADEVVGKLLLRFVAGIGAPEAYFVVRGVEESHLEAIETVLERYGLALVVEDMEGETRVVGPIGDRERRAWQGVSRRGRAIPEELVEELGEKAESLTVLLEVLRSRRLVMHDAGAYLALQSAM